MQPGSGNTHPSSLPEAVDVPGRPDFVDVLQSHDRPIPATAVRAVTPERERRPRARPDRVYVTVPAPSPEMWNFARCFAYAYVTPAAGAACKPADPAPSIRRAIHAAAPRARFELHAAGAHGSDMTVRFSSPEDREAVMEKQPFPLDGGGSLRLVREGETSNVCRLDCVALLNYPREQRNPEDIESNCRRFGHLLEVDPACYGAPDLSPVRVVVNMEHPREIPREVRIKYAADYRFRSVVPVQILRIWDMAQSTDADGNYVPLYPAAAAAAAAT